MTMTSAAHSRASTRNTGLVVAVFRSRCCLFKNSPHLHPVAQAQAWYSVALVKGDPKKDARQLI